MAELTWNPTAPLQAVAEPCRHGIEAGEPGVSICEIRGFRLLLLMARRGRSEVLRKAITKQFGADPGNTPKAVIAKNRTTLIGIGPGQYFVLAPATKSASLDKLGAAIADSATVSEQSGGRALIRMFGPRVRDCLAKMLSIDLHQDVFRTGDAAATSMAHMAVNVWRDADDAFNILVFSGFAEALWQTILDHGAEYGVDIIRPQDLR